MNGRALGLLLTVTAWSAALSAQPPYANPASVPRAAGGKPDLSGVWQGGSTIPGGWEDANSGTGVGGTGRNPDAPFVGSSNDRPAGREGAPYQPWAAKKVLESFNRRGVDDPTSRCLPAGIPRSVMLGLFPQQFVQTPTQLVILYEYMSTFRVIPFGTRHAEDALPSYMGDSVAHWDGDTLVVDITSFNDKTWLAGTGTFHSDALHIIERYTRVSKDRIDYEARIEDPMVLTKPWVLQSSLMLREGTRVQEYICSENNVDVQRYEKLLRDGVDFKRK